MATPFTTATAGNKDQRDALAAAQAYLKPFGLEDLAAKFTSWIINGESQDTISLNLQNTAEWKQRFIGNEKRKAAGLPLLSPDQYMAVESSYRQTLQQYGLPKGFYDHPNDFAGLIGNDVSATELQTRAQDYYDFAQRSTDPSQKAALAQHGLGMGDLAAYLMDQKKALPLLQKQVNAIKTQTAAQRQGLSVSNDRADYLAGLGITGDQAEQGYGQVAGVLGGTKSLASIYGGDYTQADAENEVFGNDAAAAKKRSGLASKERATFGGSSKSTLGSGSGASSY